MIKAVIFAGMHLKNIIAVCLLSLFCGKAILADVGMHIFVFQNHGISVTQPSCKKLLNLQDEGKAFQADEFQSKNLQDPYCHWLADISFYKIKQIESNSPAIRNYPYSNSPTSDFISLNHPPPKV